MTRTFSKIYGLADLRVGWGYMPPAIHDVIERVRTPFNVNGAALAAAEAAVRDLAFADAVRQENGRELARIGQAVTARGSSSSPPTPTSSCCASTPGGAIPPAPRGHGAPGSSRVRSSGRPLGLPADHRRPARREHRRAGRPRPLHGRRGRVMAGLRSLGATTAAFIAAPRPLLIDGRDGSPRRCSGAPKRQSGRRIGDRHRRRRRDPHRRRSGPLGSRRLRIPRLAAAHSGGAPRVLLRIAELIEAHIEVLAELETLDGGKLYGGALHGEAPAAAVLSLLCRLVHQAGGPDLRPLGSGAAVPRLCPARARRGLWPDHAIQRRPGHGRVEDRARLGRRVQRRHQAG